MVDDVLENKIKSHWENKNIVKIESDKGDVLKNSQKYVKMDGIIQGFIKPGSSVLDAGCGFGRCYPKISEIPNVTYTGVDFSSEMIKKAMEFHPNAEFKVHDVCEMPFKDGEFDYVICFDVIRTIPQYEKALKEMYRVSKTLLISIYVYDLETRWLMPGIQCFNESEIDGVFENMNAGSIEKNSIMETSKTNKFILYVVKKSGT